MKQALIGTAISLLLSACLYFGQGSLHRFAFYVAAATNVLCWLLIFAGGIKGQGARTCSPVRGSPSLPALCTWRPWPSQITLRSRLQACWCKWLATPSPTRRCAEPSKGVTYDPCPV